MGTAIIGLCWAASKDVESRGKDCSIRLGHVGEGRRVGWGYVIWELCWIRDVRKFQGSVRPFWRSGVFRGRKRGVHL